MNNPRLSPFLYADDCEEHGKGVPFIVEPQEVDFKLKEVRFVFYCKKCFHKYNEGAQAWSGKLEFDAFNKMFGCKISPDN